jgi:hypothetical protein
MINNLSNPFRYAKGIFSFQYLLVFVIALSAGVVQAQAKLTVKENKVNFGFVKRGEIVKNVYEVTNAGNKPLRLLDAEVPCSCTSVEFSMEPILPGQTVKVIVIFNTTTVYGRQDRVVLLQSNDDASPTILRFKGTVSTK